MRRPEKAARTYVPSGMAARMYEPSGMAARMAART
jgi:hypothetical protein